MSQSIYEGLTNEQAFNIMSARIECDRELPRLERWSEKRHWVVGSTIAVLLACVIAVGLASASQGFGITLVSAAMSASGTIFVTWWTARWTAHRLQLLRATHKGIEQFKAAAMQNPGASAADLVAAMPD